MSKLVIVESPAKAKTIKKYLGDGYEVVASMGHVRDLPKSKLGVDVEADFRPQYINIKGKEELVRSLKSAAGKSDEVYLATDPDREGEAISWHLAHILSLDLERPNRVTFNEITRSGVDNGIKNPRTVDLSLVDAQQARRVLDRIVGYKISPFLWRKIKSGLSAGRVQSVVVRLIVDREEEIKAFKTEEYWSVDAMLLPKAARKAFASKLHSKFGKKIKIPDKETADAILAELEKEEFTVAGAKTGVRKKAPAPPFITSTLQQEASRKLGFQSRRTMKAAQELYEGVEIEKLGAVGLITYMRTDSLRISDEAYNQASDFIKKTYGEKYLPEKRRLYKSKNAQDGHEAVRPTMPELTPKEVKASLTSDQYKLYKLIWERFIASQMSDALLDTVSLDINAGAYLFKSSGYTVRFDGFTVLYEEGRDEEDEESSTIPKLETGAVLKVKSIAGNQHFTQPPPRFTEASLIKALEENGIGRPSTYSPTITTVINRGYVEREAKNLKPTALGEITTQLMREQFSDIVNVEFTANMEKSLDEVEEGRTEWVNVVRGFYEPLVRSLEEAEKKMDGTRLKVPAEETDIVCELCGRNMVIKHGRFGKFLACPGFPECRNTKKIVQETGGLCPLCGGKVLAKKSKTGKGYFGCEHNPKCPFMTWDKPLSDKCPKCSSTLFRKAGRGGKVHCLKPDCGYEKAAPKDKEKNED